MVNPPTINALLILLYINDLPKSFEKLSFRIFADDTNTFFTSDNAIRRSNLQ